MSLGAERVLTRRQLNRAVLDRQLLLTRRRDSLPPALERRSVVQATLMRVYGRSRRACTAAPVAPSA